MDMQQVITALRSIARWIEDEDLFEARTELTHLLDTIDPDYREETMADRLFKDLAQALRPTDIGGGR